MSVLFVVATPIGNLDDLSPRAARVLRETPVIAAEGVNRTKKLLSHLGLAGKKLISCREANRKRAAAQVLECLSGGQDVALVSDAGTPGLSDPGGVVVQEAARAGFRVCPIPGPSSLAAALSVSGLAGAPVVFLGFLPAKSGERKRLARQGAETGWPLVIYEAPHRLADALSDLLEVLGDREAVLCRELSKVHEEVVHASLADLVKETAGREVKGEITLILEAGAPLPQGEQLVPWELADRLLTQGLAAGDVKPSKLAKQVAAQAGLPRDEVYQRLLALQKNTRGKSNKSMDSVREMDQNAHRECELKVINGLGLHARVAARIADTVQQYDCQVKLAKDGVEAAGDSVLSILTLDAPLGSTLVAKAWGSQAGQVIEALRALFERKFGEE